MSWLTTKGAAHQIGEGDTIVGSGPNAGWQLPSQDLAARHFVLSRQGDQMTVRAATVESVVAVNGQQIGLSPVHLQDGDTIDAGNARFNFSTADARKSGGGMSTVGPAHLVESRDGIAHPLTKQSVGIGRDVTNPVVVLDPTASRFHAEIRREAGGYVLHPRGSSGTWVNGRRSGTPERLRDGDRIEIANVELRFVMGPVPADAPRPGPPSGDVAASRRRTIVQSTVLEIPKEDRSRSTAWIWVVLVLVLGVTVYLAMG